MINFFAKYQVSLSPYSLQKKAKRNSLDQQTSPQQGLLIRLQDDEGFEGFADYCPLHEFGDLSIDHIFSLATAFYSSSDLDNKLKSSEFDLFNRSLHLALCDLHARKHKITLVGREFFKSNVLVSIDHLEEFIQHQVTSLRSGTIKIKVDRRVDYVSRELNKYSNVLANNNIKMRLDFNNCLTEGEFSLFLDLLNPDALLCIDYIEDPFVFNLAAWKKYHGRVPLALDRSQNIEQRFQAAAVNMIVVLKPARDHIEKFFEKCPRANVTITTSMDHPVGVAHALSCVRALNYNSKVNGLLTLDQYSATAYHNYFKVQSDELEFLDATSYGIGMDAQLQKENWWPFFVCDKNFVCVNPRSSELEKRQLFKIRNSFVNNSSDKYFVLIPSSGSTQSLNQSTKVIGLTLDALMASARRVISQFDINQNDILGCPLPSFHVGGLGVWLRSAASGCRFVVRDDISKNIVDWITENKISVTSLVPTQLFDIVRAKQKAPEFLRLVFIGGAALPFHLAKQAIDLGWNVVQTYGMTETASMIAYREQLKSDDFLPMKNVKLSVQDSKLVVYCDSLAEVAAYIDLKTENIIRMELKNSDGQLQTHDEVVLTDSGMRFLQRQSDYIKINGEGVSLSYLREVLQNICIENHIQLTVMSIVNMPDDRSENKICLVISANQGFDDQQIKIIADSFNYQVKPYERIQKIILVEKIPTTDLGKIKFNELFQLIQMKGSEYAKKI